jgi:hypothetical protein
MKKPVYLPEAYKNALARRNLPMSSTKARAWLFRKAQDAKNIKFSQLGPKTNTFEVGSMFFFIYDPKTKDVLNYYDRLPLVFPIETYVDGFLGINLHYLPPNMRAKLLDKMLHLRTTPKIDERTRLQLSYQLLNAARRYDLFKPCVKRYLWSQMRSQLIRIMPQEWDVALYIPVERFAKVSSKEQVWRQSMEQVTRERNNAGSK